jgi:hypothetical protein
VDFEQGIKAVMGFEDRPVALLTTVTRPAPGVRPDQLESATAGVLKGGELPRTADRPVDEAAWWHRRKDKTVIRIEPDSSLLLARERFRAARWDGEALEVETGAIRYRFVPLVRADGEPLEYASGAS